MLFQEPTRQGVGYFAGSILPLGECHQPVLPVLAKHLVKRVVRLDQELLSQTPQLFR
jgi:hypothetical protein